MAFHDVIGMNRRNRDLVIPLNPQEHLHLADSKTETKRWLRGLGLPVPELLSVIEAPHQIRPFLDRVEAPEGFVVKPDTGAMGNGIVVVSEPFGPELAVAPLRTRLYWHFSRILAGEFSGSHATETALVEERVLCGGFAEDLCGFPTADLRVLCIHGEIVLAMLRVPTQGSGGKANLHQGGVGVGIDLESGVTTHAIHRGRPQIRHPDTQVELGGHAIPDWRSEIVPIVQVVAEHCPLKCCGVDIMLSRRKGPVILELNARPGLAIQLANRRSLGRALAAAFRVVLFVVATVAWCGEYPASAQDPVPSTSSDPTRPGESRSLEESEARARLKPHDADARHELGLALFREGRHAEAARQLAEVGAITGSARYYSTFYYLGLCHAALGQHEKAAAAYSRAVALQPAHAPSHNNLAIELAQLGRSAEAESSYRRAIRLSPDDATAYYNLALLYRKSNRTQDAERIYRMALKEGASSPALLNNLAFMESAAGLPACSERLYRRALEVDPKYETAAQNLGILLTRIGRPQEATALLEPFIARGEPPAEILFVDGLAWLRAGDEARAQSRFEEAILRKPEYVEARHNLGLIHLRRGELDRAAEVLAPVAEAGTPAPRTLFNLALVQMRAGDLDAAEATLLAIVETSPDYPEARYNLGLVYLKREQYSKADERFAQALKLRPDYPEAWYNLGVSRLRHEDSEGAADAFRNAVAHRSDYAEAWFNLGVSLGRSRSPDSVDAFRKACSVSPDDRSYAAALGRALQRFERYGEAADAFRNAADPEGRLEESILVRMASCLEKAGRLDEADAAYRTLLEISPTNASYLYDYAGLKVRRNDLPAADRLFRKVLKQSPDYHAARLELAGILLRSGEVADAKALIETVRRAEPDFPGLVDVQRTLDARAR